MSRITDPIAIAAISLQGEVRRRGLSEQVSVQPYDSQIRIDLLLEDRQVWIGHVLNKGYCPSGGGDP